MSHYTGSPEEMCFQKPAEMDSGSW